MNTVFVDTNYFLRFLKKDNLDQYKVAEKLFLDAVLNKVVLKSSTIVFFEVYWVLKKYYEIDKDALVYSLFGVLELKVAFSKKNMLRIAVQNMKNFNYDLEDAFNFYSAKEMEVKEFATFDVRLEKAWKKAI